MVSARCGKPAFYILASFATFAGFAMTTFAYLTDIEEPKAFFGEDSYSDCSFCKSSDDSKIQKMKNKNTATRTLRTVGPVFLGVGVLIAAVVVICSCRQSCNCSSPYSDPDPVQYLGSRAVFTGQNAVQIQQPQQYPQGAGYGGTHLTAIHQMNDSRHSPMMRNPHGHMPLHHPDSNREQDLSPLPSLPPQNENCMTNSDITEPPAFNPAFQTQGIYILSLSKTLMKSFFFHFEDKRYLTKKNFS